MAISKTWIKQVNEPQTEAELTGLRRSVQRGQPYGEESWVRRLADRLGLESTLRPRGRPRKADPTMGDKGDALEKGS